MSHENAGRVVGTTRPGVGLAGVALGWARTYSRPMARGRVRASWSVSRVGRCVVLLAPACFCVLASGATAAPPPNDDLGQATPIRLGSTVRGTVTDATKQRDEARHGRLATAGSVWFRLRAKRRVGVELRTCGADFDSILAVYGGRSLRSLSVVRFNNDGCGRSRGGSRVTFTARPTRIYWIAVAGFAASGRFRLTATKVATPRNDDFVDAVPIRLSQTIPATSRKATREPGEPRDYKGSHTVWFRFSLASASEVRFDACNGSRPVLAVYAGTRLNRLTRIAPDRRIFPNDECLVQFAAQPGLSYRVVVQGGGAGVFSRFRLTARAATPPANDRFANATPITLGDDQGDDPRRLPRTRRTQLLRRALDGLVSAHRQQSDHRLARWLSDALARGHHLHGRPAEPAHQARLRLPDLLRRAAWRRLLHPCRDRRGH